MEDVLEVIAFMGAFIIGAIVLAFLMETEKYKTHEGDINIKTEIKLKEGNSKGINAKTISIKSPSGYKQKMARFEEEAFWMNVFDDDEW